MRFIINLLKKSFSSLFLINFKRKFEFIFCELFINIKIMYFHFGQIKNVDMICKRILNRRFSDALIMFISIRFIRPVSRSSSRFFEIRLNFFLVDLIRLKLSLNLDITIHKKLSCPNIELM